MSKKIFGLFILTGLLLPLAAKADSAAWEFTSPGTQTNAGAGNNFTLGIVFQVGSSNFVVDELGYYTQLNSDNRPLLTGSHAVAIYDLSTGNHTPIATADITSSSTLLGHFLTQAITPVTLTAGDYYVIEGLTGSTDDYTYGVTGLYTDPDISIVGINTQLSGGLNYDSSLDTTDPDVFGPDFGGNATPEPSSLLLLGSGLAGLAGLIKRKLMA